MPFSSGCSDSLACPVPMLLSDLNGKRVCILGYGKEGRAMFHAIERHASDAHVTVVDQSADALQELTDPLRVTALTRGYVRQSGLQWLSNLHTFDVIIKSPGIPPTPEITKHIARLTNSTDIFLAEAAARGARVIGVTGSKGKSTTATMIFDILRDAGKDVLLLGNIGEPAIAHVEEAHSGAIAVLEMSSYQLMHVRRSPHIAVITSFFPEHLDYHGSLEAYREAKGNIVRFQGPEDYVVYDATSLGAEDIAHGSRGRRVAAHAEDVPVAIGELTLKGEHNRRNAAIAFLVSKLVGVPTQRSLPVIRAFRGLRHRLESLGVHDGIEWIDDAISTNPDSTIAALDALGERVTAIILGGQDRGLDYSILGDRIARSAIRRVILFPGSGPRIRNAIEDAGAAVECVEVRTMEEAVNEARKAKHKARPADGQAGVTNHPPAPIVLLSTASPSYGMFRDFEEKGDRFRECINGENIV
jgi:UDP-N-acetylmuramoyl-L-alanine---L-glutamate ligase